MSDFVHTDVTAREQSVAPHSKYEAEARLSVRLLGSADNSCISHHNAGGSSAATTLSAAEAMKTVASLGEHQCVQSARPRAFAASALTV